MDEHTSATSKSQALKSSENSEEGALKDVSRDVSETTNTVEIKGIKNGECEPFKRRLSTSGSSEDDEACKIPRLSGSVTDEANQAVADEIELSSNEGESSSHSEGSDDSADDPQVLDDILSVKKMELLQHPQVIAFLQEKIDQAKKKGK